MNFSRSFLNIANSVVTFILVLALAFAGLYAGYSLWDNYRVYSEAEHVQRDLLRYKPDTEAQDPEKIRQAFVEMRKINPDICAWLTVDNTKIDYPVLYGENNYVYMNTDVYGEFSLAGSIFLDTRCAADFSDPYSLIYGHHMASSRMFGDLDKFKEKKFFDNNKSGTLILPDKICKLEIFSVLVVKDSDDRIFEPDEIADADILLDYAEQKAMFSDQKKMSELRKQSDVHLIALSTCADEFTDARTVVLASFA